MPCGFIINVLLTYGEIKAEESPLQTEPSLEAILKIGVVITPFEVNHTLNTWLHPKMSTASESEY